MKADIAIIDYGMGNLRSVAKAFEHIGAAARICAEPSEVTDASALVLPGVGAFGQAMDRLSAAHWPDYIRSWAGEDRPFLGICLGLQLLFTESDEFGPVAGLDLVPGRVIRFTGPAYERTADKPGLKVPHIGWNALQVVQDHPVVRNIPEGAMAYFVHSYYGVPEEESWTTIVTEHGIEFAAAVSRGHIFASQFHPEKSGEVGLGMLTNFVQMVAEAG
jgi:imidazole glycerol-phosphate synthase subunit HisH